jgi:hypothetical protein
MLIIFCISCLFGLCNLYAYTWYNSFFKRMSCEAYSLQDSKLNQSLFGKVFNQCYIDIEYIGQLTAKCKFAANVYIE